MSHAIIESCTGCGACTRACPTGGRHPVRFRDLTDSSGMPLVEKRNFDEIAQKAPGDGSIIYNPVELRYDDIIRVLEECW